MKFVCGMRIQRNVSAHVIFVRFAMASTDLAHLSHYSVLSISSFRSGCSADRPIASLAFHAQGDLLAVASGHKVMCRACGYLSMS